MTAIKLTRTELIRIFAEKYGEDISQGLRVKIDDHANNPLAPERYCYKISYTAKWLGRQKVAFWPNTVGKQCWQ